ncbi:STAS domain-containing protein [Catenulispora pinisilvae]|uniref:STAS domain-containing protein n=1 Tax=Catenulispora pinisilvae TaxID=2705253 RepID=UPI001891CE7D|nr:STAS domain-containing protein [Catenulispora pinisilvae]
MTTSLTVKRPNITIPTSRRTFIPGPRRPAETITRPRFRPDGTEPLHINIRDGYALVYFAGELDIVTRDATYATLVNLLYGTDPRLILDLRGVNFIDVVGVSTL